MFLLWFTRLMMHSILFPGFLPGTFPEKIGIFLYKAINVIRGIVQSIVLKFLSIMLFCILFTPKIILLTSNSIRLLHQIK